MPDPLVLEIIIFCLQHLSLVSGLLLREEAVKLFPASTDTPACMGKVVRCVMMWVTWCGKWRQICYGMCWDRATWCQYSSTEHILPYHHETLEYFYNYARIVQYTFNIIRGGFKFAMSPPPTRFGFICTFVVASVFRSESSSSVWSCLFGWMKCHSVCVPVFWCGFVTSMKPWIFSVKFWILEILWNYLIFWFEKKFCNLEISTLVFRIFWIL